MRRGGSCRRSGPRGGLVAETKARGLELTGLNGLLKLFHLKKLGVTHWSSLLLAAHLGSGDATVARAWF